MVIPSGGPDVIINNKFLQGENAMKNLMTLKNHLADNSGDENISKLIWVVIVFVVGAILLGLVYSAFSTEIAAWYKGMISDWFGTGKTEQAYPLT